MSNLVKQEVVADKKSCCGTMMMAGYEVITDEEVILACNYYLYKQD